MGLWKKPQQGRVVQHGISALLGTNVTFGATAHTKGAWTEIVASAEFDADGFELFLVDAGSVNKSIIDVAVGSAGNETIIVENFCIRHSIDDASTKIACFPIAIPQGARISVRGQNGGSSEVFAFSIKLMESAPSSFQLVESFGADESSSSGVLLPSSTSAKSSWIEIAFAVNGNSKYIQIPNLCLTPFVDREAIFDIGIGAAGQEVAVFSDLHFRTDSSVSTARDRMLFESPVNWPAGTRVAMRVQSIVAISTWEVSLYCYS